MDLLDLVALAWLVVAPMPVATERDGLDLALAGDMPVASDRRAFLAAAASLFPAVVGVARPRPRWLLSSSPDDSSSEDESYPEGWGRRRFLVAAEVATPGVVVASPSSPWGAEFSEEEAPPEPPAPMALTAPAPPPPQCIRGRDPGRWEKMVRVAVGRGWPSTVGTYLGRRRTETGGSRRIVAEAVEEVPRLFFSPSHHFHFQQMKILLTKEISPIQPTEVVR